MKRVALLTILIMFSFLSGCASVPMASLERDNEAKYFIVEPGKSNIYLYRNESFGGAIAMPVSLDGRMAGNTGPNTFFKWIVAPGIHDVVSHTENTARITINAIEGQNHFIWQEVKMGMWTAGSQLHEVSAEEGEKGVSECKLASTDIK